MGGWVGGRAAGSADIDGNFERFLERTTTMPMPSPSKPEEEQEDAAMDAMMVTVMTTSTSLHTVIPSMVEVSSPLACGWRRSRDVRSRSKQRMKEG